MPDINVWIALASDRHVHHARAKDWFGEIETGGASFCRVTQMGFLRLITNRHVMGTDVVTQKEGWQIYQKLSKDNRIIFLQEPPEIEEEWKKLTQGTSGSIHTLTDAYLAAFALTRGLKIISFDSDFEKMAGVRAIIL